MAIEEARAIVDACLRDREGPWHPVQDCIAPLTALLSPQRFVPTHWEKVGGIPDLHTECLNQYYRLVDTEMCYLWLQNYLNPQTASEFQAKLEHCARSWGEWCLAAHKRGLGRQGWSKWAWTDENADLKAEWDDAMEDVDAMRDYLHRLAIIINAKAAPNAERSSPPSVQSGDSDARRIREYADLVRHLCEGEALPAMEAGTPSIVIGDTQRQAAGRWRARAVKMLYGGWDPIKHIFETGRPQKVQALEELRQNILNRMRPLPMGGVEHLEPRGGRLVPDGEGEDSDPEKHLGPSIRRFVNELQYEAEGMEHTVACRIAGKSLPDDGRDCPSLAMAWDVFISHASEDKEAFVRPLAEALQTKGFRVWYDEFTLTVGDSLRRSIDRGLAGSRYGIVVISPAFLNSEWPQKELDGLVGREVDGRKVILPVWHNIDDKTVRRSSPLLADRLATSTAKGIDGVVADLLNAME
jgi:hypothetical protein